jgi:hypothetical protein
MVVEDDDDWSAESQRRREPQGCKESDDWYEQAIHQQLENEKYQSRVPPFQPLADTIPDTSSIG